MNEEKFTGKADVYDKYRPSYPSELIQWLWEKTHAETVADIGAGTGIFTKCLAVKPWQIIAVEPNADMLEKLRGNLSGLKIVNAPAEDTGISSASVDLVTAAQAFHWFDEEKFKAECRRIFTPNGRLAIVWNERSKCSLSEERDRVCEKYCGMSHRGEVGNRGSAEGDMFSRSYSLKKSDENYSLFTEELLDVFSKFEKGGAVEVPYKTNCYLGTF